jgi:cytochrome c oxidase subunit II
MSEHDFAHEDNEVLGPTPGQKVSKFLERDDVRKSFGLGLFFTVVFVILGGYAYPKWMPVIMSTDMKANENLMVAFTYISAPICGLVLGIATYTFLQRHKGDTPPEDGPGIRTNGAVVVVWSIVTSLFALLAIVWGITELNVGAEAAATDAKQAIVVEVTGSQWVWSFNYPAQGFSSTELNLPVNRPVEFKVISSDVNHSFWPVQLGVKVDANRLQTTTAETTPTKLGVFDIKCAELCGLYHAYMESTGNVMTTNDFNNWVTAQGGHSA